MTAFEFWQLVTLSTGALLALAGFFRSQELNKDSAFSELYQNLSHRSPVVRAAAATRLPSFFKYRRLMLFGRPYMHQVLLLLLNALKQDEKPSVRQALVDALSSILGRYSLGDVIDSLPSPHRGANLKGAILDELELYNFRFDGTNCTDASLERCDLGNASFVDCKLWKARLSHSKLSSANLRNAKLWAANFSHADLRHATIVVPSTNIDKNTRFDNANLSGAILSKNISELCERQTCELKDVKEVPTPE